MIAQKTCTLNHGMDDYFANMLFKKVLQTWELCTTPITASPLNTVYHHKLAILNITVVIH
jgi:hypothetical protein